MKRSEFIKLTSLTALAGSCTSGFHEDKPKIKSGIRLEMFMGKESLEDKFVLLKSMGFAGIEVNSESYDPKELRRLQQVSGLTIHSIVYEGNWFRPLSHIQDSVRVSAVQKVRESLHLARSLGASTVSVNPGVKQRSVSFETCRQLSLKSIRALLPDLEKTGIRLSLQNMWNQFMDTPQRIRSFIEELEHPLVGLSLDTGNALRFAPLQEWFALLGNHIHKIELQSYSPQSPSVWRGFQSNNLDYMLREIKKTSFRGWVTIDGHGGFVKDLKVFASLFGQNKK